MSTQKQEETRQPLFEEDEEETTRYQKRKTEQRKQPAKQKAVRDRKYYLRIFFSILAVTLLGTGTRAVYRNSTLFLEDRAVDGYLPVNEYTLYEEGSPIQEVRTLRYKDQYTSAFDEQMFETARGLKKGDSWDRFVELYGDEHYDYAGYQLYERDEEGKLYWGEYQYVDEQMTVSEFNDRYVKTGIVDPSKYEITITFEAEYLGRDILYTEKEKYDALDEYYSTWNELMGRHPRRGYFKMYLVFEPPGMQRNLPDGGLYYIAVDNLNY